MTENPNEPTAEERLDSLAAELAREQWPKRTPDQAVTHLDRIQAIREQILTSWERS